jgi:hypothetical protein
MFKFNTQSSLAITIFGLSVMAFPSLTFADHSWGNYHWARTGNPFTLQLGDNVSGAWDGHLATTRSDWDVSTVLDTAVVSGGTNDNIRKCRPTSGRVEVCNATYGNNGWLGIAQIWVSGSHITQGTAKMNDTYFNKPPYNTSAWKQMVMCQEVAHTFGLDHQDEDFNNANLGTCMDYTSDPSTNQLPNADDYKQLECIYATFTSTVSNSHCTSSGHSDSTTTIASSISSSPSRGNSKPAAHDTPTVEDEIDTSNPQEWGEVVSSKHGRRVEVYERHLGAKKKLLTFVIWAE